MIPSLRKIWLFVRLSRPEFLLGGALLYGLGVSIASYLGRSVDLGLYLMGQAVVSTVQLSTHYLNEYFDAPADRENKNRTTFSGGSGVLIPGGLNSRVAMYGAIAFLTIAATLVSILVFGGQVPLTSWVVLLLGVAGALSYNLPPLRLSASGFGEIVASVTVAALVPSFAFTLQTGELHRLLLMTTTPLVAIHLAMMIAFEMPDYASDSKYEKGTLMVRLGWARAMTIHDLAILFAYGMLLSAFMFGLPRRVALGTLISMPLAAAQIWHMWRIREGYPPHWRALTYTAAALFSLTAYLELAGYLMS